MKTDITTRLLAQLEQAQTRIARLESALKDSGEYVQCNHSDRIDKFRPGTPENAPSHISLCGHWSMDYAIDEECGFEAFWNVVQGTGDFLVAYALTPLFVTVEHRFAFYEGNEGMIQGRANRDAGQWIRDYVNKRDPWGTTSEWRRDPIPSLECIIDALLSDGRAESVLSQVAKLYPCNRKLATLCRACLNPETVPQWERQTGAWLAKNERKIYDRTFKAEIEAGLKRLETVAA